MIVDRLAKRSRRRPRASTTSNPAQWFIDWISGGTESDSGITINEETALNYVAVWQAVNIIAGDVGQLPLHVHRETADGRERATTHPAYRLLRRRPNRMMNAGVFKELLTQHVLLWGNGRAGIVRDQAGRPIDLIPFLPDRSYEEIVGGKLYHFTRIGDATQHKPFADEHVLHIKGLGDGITGYSVITAARNSIGLGLASEKHANRTLKNRGVPAVVLEDASGLTEPDARQLLADWERMHAGIDNTGRTAILRNGMKAHVLGMSHADAQLLDTRKFQRSEVGGWFNLPPHKLGVGEQSGYNSLEQENQSYLNSALMRWLVAWQEECWEKLLTEKEKREESHYIEFNTAALLRGDLLTRYKAYQIGVQSEFLSPDEVRRAENMNDRPDGQGKVYRNPNTKSAPTIGDSPGARRRGRKSQAHKLATARITELMRVERNRVTKAAATTSNFCDWLDAFYQRWPATLARALVSLGTDQVTAAELSREYAAQSKALLLTAADATPDEFPARVSRTLANWPERAAQLAKRIPL